MYKVFKKRGEGKTSDLLKKSAETGVTVLSFNHMSALYAKDMAQRMGLDVPAPLSITSENILKGVRSKVYLDDADCVIKKLFEDKFPGLELVGYSMSIDE